MEDRKKTSPTRAGFRAARAVGSLWLSHNDHFSGLGFAIIGVFIIAWVASLMVYRYARLDGPAAIPTSADLI